jgi:hypothetical protein
MIATGAVAKTAARHELPGAIPFDISIHDAHVRKLGVG